jgi:hypothetical protein
MRKHGFMAIGLTLLIAGGLSNAVGQGRPDPKRVIAAQKEAITRFAIMDGVWRGEASIIPPSGDKHELTQTERVGSALDGSVKVIEGRGYEKDGSVGFGALAILSFDPKSQAYSMRSYAQGQVGDFAVTPTDDGFSWEIPAGPMTMRYTATIKDGTWHETGERIVPGKDPVRFFEMTLSRLGDTEWPSGGAVPPK